MTGRTNWRNQRGEIRFGPLVIMVLIVVGMYLAYKLLPHKMAAYKFQDIVEEQVKFASGRSIEVENMRGTLMNRAKELELPLKPEDITINWTSSFISIKAHWAVDVEMIGYTKHWVFEASKSGPIFD